MTPNLRIGPPWRLRSAGTAVAALAMIMAACSPGAAKPAGTTAGARPPAPGTRPATSAPAQPVVKPPTAAQPGPIGFIPPAQRTPAQWMDYLGIRLVETRDASGPPAYVPKDGDVYYFSNESTTWGATNTRNNVVIIDATAKKVVARSEIPDEYSLNYSSHSVAVSQDGNWVYLGAIGPERNFTLILDAHTLKISKVYETLGRSHHINNITLPDGRDVVMAVDFNWNWSGSGVYVFDPSNDNQIIGGLGRGDFEGNPYIASGDVNGFMYVTMPATTSALRGDVEGFLAKVDLKTWKVVGVAPVLDPIWPEPTHDGKFVWVTEGDKGKVAKVDTASMKVVQEITTGPGPWGARLSYDETKLYVADKGEASGYGQQGRTMTVIDTLNNIVTNVVPIGRTTDHVLISPDGKEVWATSNADHGIWVVDTETEQLKQILKMPADGDTHGGTWVSYHSDGKGGVWGEVTASYTGLHGSARTDQSKFLSGERPPIISVTSSGVFSPSTITIAPGTVAKLTFSNSSGTNGKPVQLESQDLGLARFELGSGQRKTVDIKAPAQPGSLQVITPADPKKALTVVVADKPAAAPAPAAGAAAATGGAREVTLKALNNKFSVDSLTAKAGETLKITFTNGDDEPHNIVGGDAGMVSPIAGGGQTINFTWQAPAKPGTYKVICLFHPAMQLPITVQ